MDKRVILAVAGSGKTNYLVNSLTEDSRALILTYTDINTTNLTTRIIKKFGYIPEGIRIYKYFSFLYSFCFRPVLGHQIRSIGISWNQPPLYKKKADIAHYRDNSNRLYGSRLAKLLIEYNSMPEVISRIEKYFDYIYVDEVQDFASNDFNFLCQLVHSKIDLTVVGDFYQHSFDTSRDGTTQTNLHESYEIYLSKLAAAGFTIDLTSLSHSHRCSPTVCAFVSEHVGIAIQSHREDITELRLIDCPTQAERLFNCNNTVKLFYQSSDKYPGYTNNWGAVKGQDCYEDVCVVLNDNTLKLFSAANLNNLASLTKNKFYVACTRAKRNLYFVPEKIFKHYKKS